MKKAMMVPGEDGQMVQTRYGMKIPKSERKKAILYNKSFNIKKLDDLCIAISGGTTIKSAANFAGFTPDEFEYMVKLGANGHPAYVEFVDRFLRAKGEAEYKLAARAFEHAQTDDGVKDGTLKRVQSALERDTWADERVSSEISANVGVGQVTVNINFGDEKEVDHGWEDAEDVEFEEA